MSQSPNQQPELIPPPADSANQAYQANQQAGNGQQQDMGESYTGVNGSVPPNASNHAFVSSFMSPMRPEKLRELLGHLPSPTPAFTKSMRDLQARGKDPYEYARKGDMYYEQRLASLRRLKQSDILEASQPRPSGFFGGASASQSQNPNQVLMLDQQNQQTPAAPPPAPQTHGDQYPFPYSSIRASDYAHASLRSQSPTAECPEEEPPLDRFENLERRRQAALVLDNPELLMMFAQSTNDSIPSVRMKFMRKLCGFDSETMASPAAIADKQAEAALEAATREEVVFDEALLRLPSASSRHGRSYVFAGPSPSSKNTKRRHLHASRARSKRS